ncbi:DUF2268 domain-containing protein [Sporosarcina obsidiansis]|uniref:DUF2268 domain-containing protein n=1 Tax=Sporosarcina obsidiansis TaxID=2660748 RepID=UPI001890B632|nr:DUF2268 domain-containing putative Zn-dependent protease [Sporosarcina obsidiansis]
MTIIQTDQWLLECYERPIELCKKLTSYFKDASAGQIYQHLTSHGLYSYPTLSTVQIVSEFRRIDVWKMVQKEIQLLQKEWHGPKIPIFILPAQSTKSGLAFHDKLFIFITADCTASEIKAVVTHEYHHVCRLSRIRKNESDYTLLDVIIMEGLAEHAVRERLGHELVAEWTKWYTPSQLDEFWKTLFYPNRQLPKSAHTHGHLVYGTAGNPRLGGYAVGYHLIHRYMKASGLATAGLLGISAEQIMKEMS